MLIPGLPLRLTRSGTVHDRKDGAQVITRYLHLTGPAGVRSWLRLPVWKQTTVYPQPIIRN